MSESRRLSPTALALWALLALFVLRVAGQILVEFAHVQFLPPAPEWFSAAIPYPQLLASQILIIAVMVWVNLAFTRRSGWAYRPRRLAGSLLLAFGGVYLAVMVI